jgi:predicted pyridoxine 5'-phosphate oxidase superfamily flavin-nucleotide-binding protein
MTAPLKYHEGEIAIQKQANAFDPADLLGNGLATHLEPRLAPFLALQTWVLLAGLDHAGRVWVSLLNGPPGFLRVDDVETLRIEAQLSPGDPLGESFQSQNEIGLLVLDAQTRRRQRINGRARWVGEGSLEVKTREVYGNCPKYIQRREVTSDVRSEATEAERGRSLQAEHRTLIERADTFFIGSMHVDAGVDCSHRGGLPGFVRVLDGQRIAFPDYAGNNMFQTLGNLLLDGRAGLLFLDFETGATLQLTGKARLDWDPQRLKSWPGAQRLIEFEVIEVIRRCVGSPLRGRLIEYSSFNPR